MLNVIRSPLHTSRLSFQYEEVDHIPHRPQPKDERNCSCFFFRKDLKTAREKERIKQFSIWYAEVDKYKQEEYIKRRRKWRNIRQHRARRLWKYRTLLIPATVLIVAGSFLLVAANVNFLHFGDWFLENRRKLTVLGGISVGLGVLVFMIEQGLLSHYGNISGLKLFVQFEKIPSQNPISHSETRNSQNDFDCKNVPYKRTVLRTEREVTRVRMPHATDSIDTACSDDTAETVNDSDPLLPQSHAQSGPKTRAPKLSEIANRQREGNILSSIDTAESGLTEITLLSSERSSSSEPLGLLTEGAEVPECFSGSRPPRTGAGGGSEDVVGFVSSDRDTVNVRRLPSAPPDLLLTLQPSGSKDSLLGQQSM